MSGLESVTTRMKAKLSLGALAPTPEAKEESKARKIYTLTEDDNLRLKKIFSKRLNLTQETSIAAIMSEAIQLLYFQEFQD